MVQFFLFSWSLKTEISPTVSPGGNAMELKNFSLLVVLCGVYRHQCHHNSSFICPQLGAEENRISMDALT